MDSIKTKTLGWNDTTHNIKKMNKTKKKISTTRLKLHYQRYDQNNVGIIKNCKQLFHDKYHFSHAIQSY